jgi:hypothetical protein
MGVEACKGIFEAAANLLAELNKNEAGQALRARADILNTISFATQNASNACARLGVFSVPGLLKRAAGGVPDGLDGRGQWSPGLVQQINLTVQTMKEKTEKPAASSETVIETKPTE